MPYAPATKPTVSNSRYRVPITVEPNKDLLTNADQAPEQNGHAITEVMSTWAMYSVWGWRLLIQTWSDMPPVWKVVTP